MFGLTGEALTVPIEIARISFLDDERARSNRANTAGHLASYRWSLASSRIFRSIALQTTDSRSYASLDTASNEANLALATIDLLANGDDQRVAEKGALGVPIIRDMVTAMEAPSATRTTNASLLATAKGELPTNAWAP